ncbi:hypothetical protein [Lutispora saccharofermentans]|uniref:Uncharacterized protein n=1 Tax=Lutispora saccharofermentans TaxID=3024236 RepID=A0ABT1NI18_9FIRM|nr:hypothetical protein [Lutispora saccharofermentans]MCQ1530905.1 hypothetical protein [Lutispora saccharofermentans]
MSYITEIFDRLDIQHIREFLLHGVECVEISNKSYKQRIEDASKSAIEMIEKKFPERDDCEKITSKVYNYSGTIQDVYMEIGMQCGAILAMQLIANMPEGRLNHN